MVEERVVPLSTVSVRSGPLRAVGSPIAVPKPKPVLGPKLKAPPLGFMKFRPVPPDSVAESPSISVSAGSEEAGADTASAGAAEELGSCPRPGAAMRPKNKDVAMNHLVNDIGPASQTPQAILWEVSSYPGKALRPWLEPIAFNAAGTSRYCKA